jgi:hypothetical protein
MLYFDDKQMAWRRAEKEDNATIEPITDGIEEG